MRWVKVEFGHFQTIYIFFPFSSPDLSFFFFVMKSLRFSDKEEIRVHESIVLYL